MKRSIALILALAILAMGLVACEHDESAANNPAPVATTEDTSDVSTDPVDANQPEEPTEPTEPADPATASADAQVDDSLRGPIVILGDADFTAENGVLGGTGTEEDPYIIAAWEIVVPSDSSYGVRIENVSAHFVLRGLIIQNATDLRGAGIRIGFASGGKIEGCSVANSMNGINIISSTDIAMENCVLYVSGHGLTVVGETAEQYRHQIDDSNLYNNTPIYYFYGLDGETITGYQSGHITVANSRNMTIRNNEVVNGDGLMLAFVEDSTIKLNLAHRVANVITEHGIHLYESHNNLVETNVVKNNRLAGIQLTLANGNRLIGNIAQANDTGFRVLASDDTLIQGSWLQTNVTGIELRGGSSGCQILENTLGDETDRMAQGISLELALNNIVERNLVYGAEQGIRLEPQARDNTISENTVVLGGYGLSVNGSNNTFERNLVSQQSRGILFQETFQRSYTQGNVFRANVLADNGNHIYTNIDSLENVFTGNIFLNHGRDQVNDQGTANSWTADGVGNYWAESNVMDSDGDGVGDTPVTVHPSDVDDTAPLVGYNALDLGLGILGTLELDVVTVRIGRNRSVDIPAYTADEAYITNTGFRGFPTELIAGFPGILFVFDAEKDPERNAFTMRSVPFDLDIVFFNGEGEWVGQTTMVAQATALYAAGAPYQYALELPAGSLEDLGIDSGSTLELP